jgi:hypothetical protein
MGNDRPNSLRADMRRKTSIIVAPKARPHASLGHRPRKIDLTISSAEGAIHPKLDLNPKHIVRRN